MGPGDTSRTFTVTLENVSASHDFLTSGSFATPVGAASPAPIGPGQAYEVRFGAAPGHYLSFATMMVQSNDLFFAPDGMGVELYPAGTPLAGDITAQVMLWDAGTEANEEPGLGVNQAPRQSGADTGPADGEATVRLVDDGYTYPAVSAVLQATVTYEGGGEFTLRLENVSDSSTLQPSTGPSVAVPMAPGVFAVHTAADPFFTVGMADAGDGLEALAEDGDPSALATALADRTGLASPLAPGVFAVHDGGTPVFAGGVAGPVGLEALAEDGDPEILSTTVAAAAVVSTSGVFNTPVGAAGPGPLLPGGQYRFEVTAAPGDRLSLASMFVQSNDLFFAFGDAGLALFDGDDMPVTGDFTAQVALWDAGSEANQWPGAGPDQAPRQAGADTGAADADTSVRPVHDGFSYPAVGAVVRLTISAQ
jgi:hypothetical protein